MPDDALTKNATGFLDICAHGSASYAGLEDGRDLRRSYA